MWVSGALVFKNFTVVFEQPSSIYGKGYLLCVTAVCFLINSEPREECSWNLVQISCHWSPTQLWIQKWIKMRGNQVPLTQRSLLSSHPTRKNLHQNMQHFLSNFNNFINKWANEKQMVLYYMHYLTGILYNWRTFLYKAHHTHKLEYSHYRIMLTMSFPTLDTIFWFLSYNVK
jgi:hypothetical protein